MTLLVLVCSFSVNAFVTKGQSPRQLTAKFDELISSQFKGQEPGGVVLITQNGKIIYRKAFGLANVELEVPMKDEIVFNIASITKQFTAVAILQLVEQGKLSLRDHVTKYLPDYPAGAQITIENLLTHTAGVPGPAPEAMAKLQARRDLVSLPEIIATFENRPLDFAPGTKWSYSNNGYMLLGAIIEKVSGSSYSDYLEKNIFKPAGMTQTHFGDDYVLIKNRAASYVYSRSESRFLNARNEKIELAYSAGAIQSTAEDLFKWNEAIRSHKLIKKESLEKAQTEYKLPGGKGTNYGYGWFIGNIQGSPIVEHGGNMGGFMSHSIYLPQEDVFAVVLYNFRTATHLPEFLAGDLAALTIHKPFNIREIAVADNVLKTYVGVYEDEGVERLITVEGGKLYYQRTGANKLSMKPYAADKFFFENTAVIGEFKRDAKNNIISLEVSNKRGISSSVLRRTDKPVPVSATPPKTNP
ncbi:MAG: serine hydrolase [Acidobacteria bacterium]|nr:serine hydrolase [Acidobacteriota bacterium]